jgi:hypothetical protein
MRNAGRRLETDCLILPTRRSQINPLCTGGIALYGSLRHTPLPEGAILASLVRMPPKISAVAR